MGKVIKKPTSKSSRLMNAVFECINEWV